MNELTLLLVRSQFSLWLNCSEILWLHIDKSRLQCIPQNVYCKYLKNSLSREFSISKWNMVSYDLLLFMLNIDTQTRGKTPCHSSFSSGDHLRSTSGIICGPIFGDHLRSGYRLRSGIICGAVQDYVVLFLVSRKTKSEIAKLLLRSGKSFINYDVKNSADPRGCYAPRPKAKINENVIHLCLKFGLGG